MKTKIRFLTLLTTGLMFLISSPEARAQKKKNRVKSHVKQNHRRKVTSRAHVRRAANYKYRKLPRRGKVVRKVRGAGIGFRGIQFRFYDGVWYRSNGRRFIVAKAPFGIRVRALPMGFRRLVIGPRPYFYYYGTFYVKMENSNEYEVVAAPIGAVVEALPDDYKVIRIKDVEYFKLDDTYYVMQTDANGETVYVVVKDPIDE